MSDDQVVPETAASVAPEDPRVADDSQLVNELRRLLANWRGTAERRSARVAECPVDTAERGCHAGLMIAYIDVARELEEVILRSSEKTGGR